jgi:hypothetical protein
MSRRSSGGVFRMRISGRRHYDVRMPKQRTPEEEAVLEAALAWLARFEGSGLVVADLDPEAQRLVAAARALRAARADD